MVLTIQSVEPQGFLTAFQGGREVIPLTKGNNMLFALFTHCADICTNGAKSYGV